MSTPWPVAVALAFAACASGSPSSVASAEGITTLAVVTLLGDDFALLDGQRMPLDAVVLRLRLRVREMTKEQLAAFGVRIAVDARVPEAATARVVAARGRLLDELDIMEVGYVKT